MPAQIASVSGADNYLLKYRVWAPARAKPRATLIFFNGVMSHSAWLDPFGTRLAGAGFHVVGADRRGSGANELARGDAPSAKALIEDARAIVEREHAADQPLYLLGWCWGATLAINLAAEMSDRLKGLVLLAPGLYPTELLTTRMAASKNAGAGAAEDAAVLESPIDEELFTRGDALRSFILQDEQRLLRFTPRFASIMARMGLVASTKIAKLEKPILLLLASADRATDNTKTRAGLAKVPNLEVEEVPGEHGLQFEAPDETVRRIVAWIDRHE